MVLFFQYPGVNIIGQLSSRYTGTRDDNIVVIGAHYDSVDTTPGVNDNGSGVTALLQALKLYTSPGKLFSSTNLLHLTQLPRPNFILKFNTAGQTVLLDRFSGERRHKLESTAKLKITCSSIGLFMNPSKNCIGVTLQQSSTIVSSGRHSTHYQSVT